MLTCVILSLLSAQVNCELYLSFLELKDAETSLGTIGSGLESLSDNLLTFNEYIEESVESLQSQLESTGEINRDTSLALLESEKNELEFDYSKTEEIYEYLESLLDTLEGCGDYKTCYDCVLDSECEWCNDTEECQSADEDCEDAEYAECPSSGCELYTSCSTCIADPECGWCTDGEYCLGDSSGCDSEFYYDSEDTCPESDANDELVDVSDVFIDWSTNSLTATEIENTLENLTTELESIQTSIDLIEEEITQLEEIDLQGEDIELGETLSVNGISGTVDSMYKQEIEDSEDYQDELVSDSATDLVNEIDILVDESVDEILDAIDESYGGLEDELADTEDSLDESIDELEQEALG